MAAKKPFGGKKAAPFKSGGGRNPNSPKTATGKKKPAKAKPKSY
jgi:hypothetical protein